MLYHYEVCNKCDEKYTDIDERWCRSCQINYLKNNFTNWTSGNEKIDDFIQKKQLKINWHYYIIIEWIPYNQFVDVKKIEKNVDNAATIYSALWNNGSLHYDSNQEELTRKPNIKVVLKCLNNFQNIIDEYLIEAIACYENMHGISQNPDTKDYIIILQDIYCEKCGEQYTNKYNKWCEPCHINYFENEFKNWTSGNEIIDDIIQEIQLKINSFNDKIVEWIPYNQFINIEEIGKIDDNTATIYSALWNNGLLHYNEYKKEWIRNPNLKVTLKCFRDSQDIFDKLLKKDKNYNIGISQNPNTKEYIIVQDKYCEKCDEKYTNKRIKWCGSCHINYFENEFKNWTSGNETIDDIILEMQLKFNSFNDKIVEWIPYNQFINIEEIGKVDDNTATIYSALWSNGSLCYNNYKREWTRDPNIRVTLKCFNDSQNIIDELLNEAKGYNTCYGISQDPNTNEYIIILRNRIYRDELCRTYHINYLKNNFTKWTSGNEQIDILIQKLQLTVDNDDRNICEWIPYNQFVNIEEIENNDLLTIHSAIWNVSPSYYNSIKEKIIRKPKKVTLITLNYLNKSQNMIVDFLNKVKNILMVNNCKVYDSFHKKYYSLICGMSQNPDSRNYIIVSQDEYCEKCSKQYTDIYDQWCNSCQMSYFKNNLTNWSGNKKIDDLIQEMQLKKFYINRNIVEWIPYDQFINIKETAKDNNNTTIIYSAIWKNGPLYISKKWIRNSYTNVILKSLDINEFPSKANNYNGIYGISQNPDTREYIMVSMVLSNDEYCEKCGELYTDKYNKWCKPCHINYFNNESRNWTSGNEIIDDFILEMQLNINNYDKIVEWIPYNQFININEMAKNNNNNTVIMYTAIWKNGPLYYKKKWIKKSNEKVVLNYLTLDIKEFFNKVNNYENIYGISQNPDTKNYFIVLNNKKYIPWLILQNNFTNLSGNKIIDDFIQKMQLKVNNWTHIIVEWIPYDQFTDIKEIKKVGDNTAITYSAIWKNGPLCYSYDKKEWIRNPNKKVILNCLALDIEKFLNKVYYYNYYSNIYGTIGISQNPITNDYILVLQNRNCKGCGKPYNDLENKWYKLCKINYIQKHFMNWSGNNEKIDNFIQEKQLKINGFNDIVVEWIPYNQFIDIKEIGKVDNNVAMIYSAIWKNGPLYHEEDRKEWIRNSCKKVVLKYLTLDINKFFIEANNYNNIYGISQNPNTNDYILVLQNDQYCNRCSKPYGNLENKWCKCQINYIQNNLTNWSGNQKIDDFIQEMHLKIDNYDNIIFEWIPYNQFDYIEEVGKGGFATIYSAIWNDGPLKYNYIKKIYERGVNYKEVALKCIDNSHNITDEFLNEIKAYSIIEFSKVLKVYGISQDPNTKNYIIVLQYAKCGSFNNWMHYFYKNFNGDVKYYLLNNIFNGLKEIHQKQLFHQDFHIGNILVNNNENLEGIPLGIHISDMGLCGEVGDKNKTKIYGVMPYVAPEVLRGKPYTQAADIYSFGMVMYYIITGRQPFENCAHDGLLALDICRGIRPEIPEIPELKSNQYIDLMKKCWDSDPDNRPNVELIHTMLADVGQTDEIEKAEKYLFKEYKENKQLTTTNPQAIYSSRLLNPYTEGLSTYFTELNDEK
ncbi:unnamed protein product [Rhizophagus irregularis]|nr:unnamed protein product [Rhizophagus irregularis]